MEFELNKVYENFKLVRKEFVKEVEGEVYIFEHIKTKTKLLKIFNEDNEKVFAISFKTLPEDNCGTPHILEHSVLSGSKNYPLKDPFVELNRTTINSFLNAFTYPDKTIYPFATTNEKEFRKITDIYLDAVFNPLVYEKEEIFRQEGWRFEFDENNKLKYNGVVYGEMCGVFSSLDGIMEYSIMKNLFPNSVYRYNYGGDPREIPNLDYKKFLEFHKKYYHPSNSKIYISGNSNLLDDLKSVDKFLKNYDYKNINNKITLDLENIKKESKEIFPVSEEENLNNKYTFAYNFLVNNYNDYKLNLSFKILVKILVDLPNSPLKNRIYEENLGENFYVLYDNDYKKNFISFILQNTNLKNKTKFLEIFNETLNEFYENGINKDLLEAAMNKIEFQLKNPSSNGLPEGLSNILKITRSWNYNGDPIENLKYEEKLKKIKEDAKNGYFENLIKDYFLENKLKNLTILEPKKNYDFLKVNKDRLKKIEKELTGKEKEKIIELQNKVRDFQEREDSEEIKDKIKKIELKEIDKKPFWLDFDIKNINNIEIIDYKSDLKGISYVNFFFDSNIIKKEDLPYLSLLANILDECGTKNYTLDEFSNKINKSIGNIDFDIIVFENRKNNTFIKFVLKTSFLEKNLKEYIEVLNEYFKNIVFDIKKIKEIIYRIKSKYEVDLIGDGHFYSFLRVSSYHTLRGEILDHIEGIGFYKFLKDLLDSFDENLILNKLKEIYLNIFNKNNLLISVCRTSLDLDFISKLNLNQGKKEVIDYLKDKDVLNEGFLTESNIQYVSKGFNLKNINLRYRFKYELLKMLFRYKYLWEEIRVKGGAYGAGLFVNRDNDFVFFSYRDPNLKRTIEVYDNSFEFLKNLNINEKEIKNYIISSISSLDKPLKPFEQIFLQTLYYLREISYEELVKEREELLNFQKKDFEEFKDVLNKFRKESCFVVIGNKNIIKENKELFDKINEL